MTRILPVEKGKLGVTQGEVDRGAHFEEKPCR